MEGLDKVFPWKMCITLRNYDNRIAHAVNTCAKVNWSVQMYVAERDKENTMRGCYMSHVNVMKKALAANVPYALVLEDDIDFPTNIPNIEEKVREIDAFVKNEPFDILLIGWCPCSGSDDSFCKNLCVTTRKPYKHYKHIDEGTCWCTHAIVYSRDFMNMFVSQYGDYDLVKEEIDEQFLKIPGVRMFMMKEPLVEQNRDAIESAIWGGQPVSLPNIQKTLKWYKLLVWVLSAIVICLVAYLIVYIAYKCKPSTVTKRLRSLKL